MTVLMVPFVGVLYSEEFQFSLVPEASGFLCGGLHKYRFGEL
jgi:hypothetical protein